MTTPATMRRCTSKLILRRLARRSQQPGAVEANGPRLAESLGHSFRGEEVRRPDHGPDDRQEGNGR